MTLTPHVKLLLMINRLSVRPLLVIDSIEQVTLLLTDDQVVFFDLWYRFVYLVPEPASYDGHL